MISWKKRCGISRLFLLSIFVLLVFFIVSIFAFLPISQDGCCYLTGSNAVSSGNTYNTCDLSALGLHYYYLYNSSESQPRNADGDNPVLTSVFAGKSITNYFLNDITPGDTCDVLASENNQNIMPGCCILRNPKNQNDNYCVWFNSSESTATANQGGKFTCYSGLYFGNSISADSTFNPLFDLRFNDGYTDVIYDSSMTRNQCLRLGGNHNGNGVYGLNNYDTNCASFNDQVVNFDVRVENSTGAGINNANVQVTNGTNYVYYASSAITGDGWYNFSVEKGYTYNISVLSVPGNYQLKYVDNVVANSDVIQHIVLITSSQTTFNIVINYNRTTNYPGFNAPYETGSGFEHVINLGTSSNSLKHCVNVTGNPNQFLCKDIPTQNGGEIINIDVFPSSYPNLYYNCKITDVTGTYNTCNYGSLNTAQNVEINLSVNTPLYAAWGRVINSTSNTISQSVSAFIVNGSEGNCQMRNMNTENPSYTFSFLASNQNNTNGIYTIYAPAGKYCIYVRGTPKYANVLANNLNPPNNVDVSSIAYFRIENGANSNLQQNMPDITLSENVFSINVTVSESPPGSVSGATCYLYTGRDQPYEQKVISGDNHCVFDQLKYNPAGYSVITEFPNDNSYWPAFNFTDQTDVGADGVIRYNQVLVKKNYIKSVFFVALNKSCVESETCTRLHESANCNPVENDLNITIQSHFTSYSWDCIVSNATITVESMDNRSYPESLKNDIHICNVTSQYSSGKNEILNPNTGTGFSCLFSYGLEKNFWYSSASDSVGKISRTIMVDSQILAADEFQVVINTTSQSYLVAVMLDNLPFDNCSSLPAVRLDSLVPIKNENEIKIGWSKAYQRNCNAQSFYVKIYDPISQKITSLSDTIPGDATSYTFSLDNWNYDYRVCVQALYEHGGITNCSFDQASLSYQDCSSECSDPTKGEYGTCMQVSENEVGDANMGFFYCANSGNPICADLYSKNPSMTEFCAADVNSSNWHFDENGENSNLFIEKASSGSYSSMNYPIWGTHALLYSNYHNYFEPDIGSSTSYRYKCDDYNRIVGADNITFGNNEKVWTYDCNAKGDGIGAEDIGVNLVCKKFGDKTTCVPQQNCAYDLKLDSLGIFYSNQTCIFYHQNGQLYYNFGTGSYLTNYCYYEKSFSNFGTEPTQDNTYGTSHKDTFTSSDECVNCNPLGSCFDYKTEDSCDTDNCGYLNCTWVPTNFSVFGFGVCKSKIPSNSKCNLCFGGENQYLSECTKDKCSALGPELINESSYGCYFDSDTFMSDYTIMNTINSEGTKLAYNEYIYGSGHFYSPDYSSTDKVWEGAFSHNCRTCSDLNCYDIDDPSAILSYTFDKVTNKITTIVKNDTCNYDICNSANGNIVKDGNGDGIDDCAGDAFKSYCQEDMTPPTTKVWATGTPLTKNSNLLLSVSKHIPNIDDMYEKKAYTLNMTYFCIDTTNTCDPDMNAPTDAPNTNNCWKYNCSKNNLVYPLCYSSDDNSSITYFKITNYPDSCTNLCRTYLSVCPITDNNSMPFYFNITYNPIIPINFYGSKSGECLYNGQNCYIDKMFSNRPSYNLSVFTREGLNFIRFFSIDSDNNYELLQSQNFTVNTIGPVITIYDNSTYGLGAKVRNDCTICAYFDGTNYECRQNQLCDNLVNISFNISVNEAGVTCHVFFGPTGDDDTFNQDLMRSFDNIFYNQSQFFSYSDIEDQGNNNAVENLTGNQWYRINATCTDPFGNSASKQDDFYADTNTYINNEEFFENPSIPSGQKQSPLSAVYITQKIFQGRNLGDELFNENEYFDATPCVGDSSNDGCNKPAYVSGPVGSVVPYQDVFMNFTTAIPANCYKCNSVNNCLISYSLQTTDSPDQTYHTVEINSNLASGQTMQFMILCQYPPGSSGSYNYTNMTYRIYSDYGLIGTPYSSLIVDGYPYQDNKWYPPQSKDPSLVPAFSPAQIDFSTVDYPAKNMTVMVKDFCKAQVGTCNNFGSDDLYLDQSETVCFRTRDYGNQSQQTICKNVLVDNIPPILIMNYQNITNNDNYNISGYVIDYHRFGDYDGTVTFKLDELSMNGFQYSSDYKSLFSSPSKESSIIYDTSAYSNVAYGVRFESSATGSFECNNDNEFSPCPNRYVDFVFGINGDVYYALRVNNTYIWHVNPDGTTDKQANRNIDLLLVSGSTTTVIDQKILDYSVNSGYFLVYKDKNTGKVKVMLYSWDPASSKDLVNQVIYNYELNSINSNNIVNDNVGINTYDAGINIIDVGLANINGYFNNTLFWNGLQSKINVTFGYSIPLKLSSVINEYKGFKALDKMGTMYGLNYFWNDYNNVNPDGIDIIDKGSNFAGAVVLDQQGPNVTDFTDASHENMGCPDSICPVPYTSDVLQEHFQYEEPLEINLAVTDCTGPKNNGTCILPQYSAGLKDDLDVQVKNESNYDIGCTHILKQPLQPIELTGYGFNSSTNIGSGTYDVIIDCPSFKKSDVGHNFTIVFTVYDNFGQATTYTKKLKLIDIDISEFSFKINNAVDILDEPSLPLRPWSDQSTFFSRCFNIEANSSKSLDAISDFSFTVEGSKNNVMPALKVYANAGCNNADLGYPNPALFSNGNKHNFSIEISGANFDINDPPQRKIILYSIKMIDQEGIVSGRISNDQDYYIYYAKLTAPTMPFPPTFVRVANVMISGMHSSGVSGDTVLLINDSTSATSNLTAVTQQSSQIGTSEIVLASNKGNNIICVADSSISVGYNLSISDHLKYAESNNTYYSVISFEGTDDANGCNLIQIYPALLADVGANTPITTYTSEYQNAYFYFPVTLQPNRWNNFSLKSIDAGGLYSADTSVKKIFYNTIRPSIRATPEDEIYSTGNNKTEISYSVIVNPDSGIYLTEFILNISNGTSEIYCSLSGNDLLANGILPCTGDDVFAGYQINLSVSTNKYFFSVMQSDSGLPNGNYTLTVYVDDNSNYDNTYFSQLVIDTSLVGDVSDNSIFILPNKISRFINQSYSPSYHVSPTSSFDILFGLDNKSNYDLEDNSAMIIDPLGNSFYPVFASLDNTLFYNGYKYANLSFISFPSSDGIYQVSFNVSKNITTAVYGDYKTVSKSFYFDSTPPNSSVDLIGISGDDITDSRLALGSLEYCRDARLEATLNDASGIANASYEIIKNGKVLVSNIPITDFDSIDYTFAQFHIDINVTSQNGYCYIVGTEGGNVVFDGDFDINITSSDKLSNFATSTITKTVVDTIGPQITVLNNGNPVALTNDDNGIDDLFYVKGDYNLEIGTNEAANCTVVSNRLGYTSSTGKMMNLNPIIHYKNLSNLINGTVYVMNISCYDESYNPTLESFEMMIDNQPISITGLDLSGKDVQEQSDGSYELYDVVGDNNVDTNYNVNVQLSKDGMCYYNVTDITEGVSVPPSDSSANYDASYTQSQTKPFDSFSGHDYTIRVTCFSYAGWQDSLSLNLNVRADFKVPYVSMTVLNPFEIDTENVLIPNKQFKVVYFPNVQLTNFNNFTFVLSDGTHVLDMNPPSINLGVSGPYYENITLSNQGSGREEPINFRADIFGTGKWAHMIDTGNDYYYYTKLLQMPIAVYPDKINIVSNSNQILVGYTDPTKDGLDVEISHDNLSENVTTSPSNNVINPYTFSFSYPRGASSNICIVGDSPNLIGGLEYLYINDDHLKACNYTYYEITSVTDDPVNCNGGRIVSISPSLQYDVSYGDAVSLFALPLVSNYYYDKIILQNQNKWNNYTIHSYDDLGRKSAFTVTHDFYYNTISPKLLTPKPFVATSNRQESVSYILNVSNKDVITLSTLYYNISMNGVSFISCTINYEDFGDGSFSYPCQSYSLEITKSQQEFAIDLQHDDFTDGNYTFNMNFIDNSNLNVFLVHKINIDSRYVGDYNSIAVKGANYLYNSSLVLSPQLHIQSGPSDYSVISYYPTDSYQVSDFNICEVSDSGCNTVPSAIKSKDDSSSNISFLIDHTKLMSGNYYLVYNISKNIGGAFGLKSQKELYFEIDNDVPTAEIYSIIVNKAQVDTIPYCQNATVYFELSDFSFPSSNRYFIYSGSKNNILDYGNDFSTNDIPIPDGSEGSIQFVSVNITVVKSGYYCYLAGTSNKIPQNRFYGDFGISLNVSDSLSNNGLFDSNISVGDTNGFNIYFADNKIELDQDDVYYVWINSTYKLNLVSDEPSVCSFSWEAIPGYPSVISFDEGSNYNVMHRYISNSGGTPFLINGQDYDLTVNCTSENNVTVSKNYVTVVDSTPLIINLVNITGRNVVSSSSTDYEIAQILSTDLPLAEYNLHIDTNKQAHCYFNTTGSINANNQKYDILGYVEQHDYTVSDTVNPDDITINVVCADYEGNVQTSTLSLSVDLVDDYQPPLADIKIVNDQGLETKVIGKNYNYYFYINVTNKAKNLSRIVVANNINGLSRPYIPTDYYDAEKSQDGNLFYIIPFVYQDYFPTPLTGDVEFMISLTDTVPGYFGNSNTINVSAMVDLVSPQVTLNDYINAQQDNNGIWYLSDNNAVISGPSNHGTNPDDDDIFYVYLDNNPLTRYYTIKNSSFVATSYIYNAKNKENKITVAGIEGYTPKDYQKLKDGNHYLRFCNDLQEPIYDRFYNAYYNITDYIQKSGGDEIYVAQPIELLQDQIGKDYSYICIYDKSSYNNYFGISVPVPIDSPKTYDVTPVDEAGNEGLPVSITLMKNYGAPNITFKYPDNTKIATLFVNATLIIKGYGINNVSMTLNNINTGESDNYTFDCIMNKNYVNGVCTTTTYIDNLQDLTTYQGIVLVYYATSNFPVSTLLNFDVDTSIPTRPIFDVSGYKKVIVPNLIVCTNSLSHVTAKYLDSENISNVSVNIDNGASISISSNYSSNMTNLYYFDVSAVFDNSYVVNVTAAKQNAFTENYNVILDTTGPVITYASNLSTQREGFILDIDVNESCGVDIVTASIYNDQGVECADVVLNNIAGTNEYYKEISESETTCSLKEGTYTVNYYLRDVLQNVKNYTIPYDIIDVDPPIILSITPKTSASTLTNYYAKVQDDNITINLLTDEDSTCNLSSGNIVMDFSTDNGLNHAISLFNIPYDDNQHKVYSITCTDKARTPHTTLPVTYDIEKDTTPPVISLSLDPVTTLQDQMYVVGHTLSSTLEIFSNKPVLCKLFRTYGGKSYDDFASMSMQDKWNNYDLDPMYGMSIPDATFTHFVNLESEDVNSEGIEPAQVLLDQETYTYYVICQDEAGNFATSEQSITFSTNSEMDLAVYDIDPYLYTNKEDFNLTFKTARLASCSLTYKVLSFFSSLAPFTTVDLGTSMNFSYELSNQQNDMNITILCSDQDCTLGCLNSSTTSYILSYDSTAPVLSITNPVNMTTFSDMNITVDGTVSDNGKSSVPFGEKGITFNIYRNGVLVSVSNIMNGNIHENTYLLEGENNLSFVATDPAGNSFSVNRTVYAEFASSCYDCDGDGYCDFSQYKNLGNGYCMEDNSTTGKYGGTGIWVPNTCSSQGNGCECVITDTNCKKLYIQEPSVKYVSVHEGDILPYLSEIIIEFDDPSGVLNISKTGIVLSNLDSGNIVPIVSRTELTDVEVRIVPQIKSAGNYMLSIIPVNKDLTLGIVPDPITFTINYLSPYINFTFPDGYKTINDYDPITGKVLCVGICQTNPPAKGSIAMIFNNLMYTPSDIPADIWLESGEFTFASNDVYLRKDGEITPNLFTLNVSDDAGRIGTKSLLVYNDKKPPTITFVSPIDGYTKDDNPTIIITTDEPAICRYSKDFTYDQNFLDYPYAFDPQLGGTYHVARTYDLNVSKGNMIIYISCVDAELYSMTPRVVLQTYYAKTLIFDNNTSFNISAGLEKDAVLDADDDGILRNSIFVHSTKEVSCDLYGDIEFTTNNYAMNQTYSLSNLEDNRTYDVTLVCNDKAITSYKVFNFSFVVDTNQQLEIKNMVVSPSKITQGNLYVGNNSFVLTINTNRRSTCGVYDSIADPNNRDYSYFKNPSNLDSNHLMMGYSSDFKTHTITITKKGNFNGSLMKYQFACELNQPGKQGEVSGPNESISFTLDTVSPVVTFKVLKNSPIRAGMLPIQITVEDSPDTRYPYNGTLIFINQTGYVDENGTISKISDLSATKKMYGYNYLVVKQDMTGNDEGAYLDGNATLTLINAEDRAGNSPIYYNNSFVIDTMALKPIYNIYQNGIYNPDCMKSIYVIFENDAIINSVFVSSGSNIIDASGMLIDHGNMRLFELSLSSFNHILPKYGAFDLTIYYTDANQTKSNDTISFTFAKTFCQPYNPKLDFNYIYKTVNSNGTFNPSETLPGEVILPENETPTIPSMTATFTSVFSFNNNTKIVTSMTYELDENFLTSGNSVSDGNGIQVVGLTGMYNGFHMIMYNVSGIVNGSLYTAGPFVRTFNIDTIAPNPRLYTKSNTAYIEIT